MKLNGLWRKGYRSSPKIESLRTLAIHPTEFIIDYYLYTLSMGKKKKSKAEKEAERKRKKADEAYDKISNFLMYTIYIVVAIALFKQQHTLKKTGYPYDGVVLETKISTYRTNMKIAKCSVVYGGKTITVETYISDEVYFQLSVGDTVTVILSDGAKYSKLPKNPNIRHYIPPRLKPYITNGN